MENLITTKQVGNRLGLSYSNVLARANQLGVEPEQKLKSFFWSNDQVEAIAGCRMIRGPKRTFSKHSPNKILIVDYYINNRENGIALIAEKFDVGVFYVTDVLNEYFVDKCIIVESSLNLIK